MARPVKDASCRPFLGQRIFKPIRTPMAELEVIELSLREFEALRCCDLEGLDQEQASMKMNISRATVHRLLKSGRRKLLNAIVKSHALKIEEPPLKRRKKHEQK